MLNLKKLELIMKDLEKNNLFNEFLINLLDYKKEELNKIIVRYKFDNSFIKLDLSNRNMKKNKQSSYFMKKVFNHLLKKFGYTVTYYTNTNFDFLYEVLPILLKKKLIDDYYISNDLKYIYLLKTKI